MPPGRRRDVKAHLSLETPPERVDRLPWACQGGQAGQGHGYFRCFGYVGMEVPDAGAGWPGLGRLVDVGEPRRGLGKAVSRAKVCVMCRAAWYSLLFVRAVGSICSFNFCPILCCICVVFVCYILTILSILQHRKNNTSLNGRVIRRTSRCRHRRPHAQHLLPPTPARSSTHCLNQPCQRDQRCHRRRLRPLARRSRHRNPPRLVRVEAELRDIATHQSTCG